MALTVRRTVQGVIMDADQRTVLSALDVNYKTSSQGKASAKARQRILRGMPEQSSMCNHSRRFNRERSADQAECKERERRNNVTHDDGPQQWLQRKQFGGFDLLEDLYAASYMGQDTRTARPKIRHASSILVVLFFVVSIRFGRQFIGINE